MGHHHLRFGGGITCLAYLCSDYYPLHLTRFIPLTAMLSPSHIVLPVDRPVHIAITLLAGLPQPSYRLRGLPSLPFPYPYRIPAVPGSESSFFTFCCGRRTCLPPACLSPATALWLYRRILQPYLTYGPLPTPLFPDPTLTCCLPRRFDTVPCTCLLRGNVVPSYPALGRRLPLPLPVPVYRRTAVGRCDDDLHG